MKNQIVANIKKNAILLLQRKVFGDDHVMLFWAYGQDEKHEILSAMKNSDWIHSNTFETDEGHAYIMFSRG